MRRLFFLFLFFVSVFARAHAHSSDTSCNTDVYKGRFYDPVPRYGAISRTLFELERGEPKEVRCLDAFAATAEGRKLLQEGRRARLLYLSALEREFPDRGDVQLVLTPGHEIRKRLFGLIERGKKRPGETKPKLWEVRARALSETLTRFALPPQMTDSELEQHGRSDPEYFPALDYFHRREHRLSEQMTSIGPVQDRNPEKFKAQMIERLTQLRLTSFSAALREAPELYKEKISLAARTGKQIASMTVEELSRYRFGFFTSNQIVPSHTLKDRPEKQSSSLTSTFLRAFIDKAGNEVYDFELGRDPSFQTLVFVLTSPEGKTFTISESDFNKLLFSLLPHQLSDYFSEKALSHRYRIEALARDFHLAETAQLLRGKSDKTLEELYGRLTKWIKSEIEIDGSFLSDLIVTRGEKGIDDSNLTNLLWYGWGKHPAWWSVREKASYKLNLPDSLAVAQSQDQFSYPRPESEKKRKRAIKREEEKQAYRYGSEQTRRRAAGKKLATWASVGLGAIVAYKTATLPEIPAMPPIQMPELPKLDLSLPKIQLPFDFSFLPNLFGGRRDEMNFNDTPRFDNYRIDPPKEASGQSKNENSAHEPTHSDYAIEILKISPNAPRPRYYNFATVAHLPEALRKPVNYNLDAIKNLQLPVNTADKQKPDLIVDVNLRSYSLNKRVGILQMANYRITALDLYDGWGRKVSPQDFQVYEIPGNRQTYAKLNDSVASGPYSYRAQYQIDNRYSISSFNPVISSSTLGQITGRLQSSGFTELSAAIQSQIQPRQNVTFSDLSAVWQGGATYTFSSQKWSIRKDADPAFQPFTKFLNDGRLFYQCTGSNILFQTALNEAIKLQPDLNGVRVEHLVGYSGGGNEGVLKGSPSHLHTVAHRILGPADEYLELDATPPADTPEQGFQTLQPNTPRPQDGGQDRPLRAILPQRPKYYVPQQAEEEKKEEVKEEPVVEQAPPPKPLPPPPKPLEHAEIEQILKMLRALRADAVESFKPIYESEPWLAKQNFLALPGVRLIVLSNYLLEGFQDKIALERLLARLKAPKADNAELALNQFFKTEFAGFDRSLPRLDMMTDQDKYAGYSFLVQDPLRSRLRELAQFLSSFDWGRLLREYNEFHAKSPCEKALESSSPRA